MPKALSQLRVWQAAVKASPDARRAKQYLDQLAGTVAAPALAKALPAQARLLAKLLGGSQAMGNLLLAHPGWIHALSPELLAHPRRKEGLTREVNGWLPTALVRRDYGAALTPLREFKQRELLRIATRDLARLGPTSEILLELSTLADVCLASVLRICLQQLSERLGLPYHRDAEGRWQATAFTVIGLGKLGGQELNYSSDVDVVFVYSEEGHVFKEPPRGAVRAEQALTSHQFFKRLAESWVAEVSRSTSEGMLFRIDLRLRPEGDTGPLTRSLGSYENYYAQWGQTWERMMLIKARGVAGDVGLAAEFLEMVQPFRYPRSLSEGVLREIGAMKARIENEVVRAGELERNVKLGRGGIREIEFIAQTAQLLHAGRIPFLQSAQTLPTLEKLVQYKLMTGQEAKELTVAYEFLRDVEHRLQMENNLQTHTIPVDRAARERLARSMGFADADAFEKARQEQMGRVRRIYDQTVQGEAAPAASSFPRQFRGAETEWKTLLARHSFRDVDQALRLLTEFAHGPGFVHVSNRTVELAWELIPKLFALCRKPEELGRDPNAPMLSDPDRVVARLDSFVSAYGSRAMLFDTWASNPSLFELMLLLFDRSEFLAEVAIRTPDLVDELVLSGRLRRGKTAAETLDDLRHGKADRDQRRWLRRYHQAELMRIGLRDILGLADFEHNLTEISALADACLAYALEVVLRAHKLKTPPFVIIGLSKLGGLELNYGSDLDLLFVAPTKTKDLSKLQRLAVEVMDLLSTTTELGVAFETDARLRPDGEKGLLVNTLAAYEEYYRLRAQLWEIQAITRTRPIAGNLALGGQFQELAGKLTNFRQPGTPPTAYASDWKRQITRMRQRIEKERTPAGQDALAIKTGAGGLIDAEFIAQALCLEHGWSEANTLRALERARAARALAPADAEALIGSYRRLRRVEGILRRWSFVGETVLPIEPAPFHRVSVRCGFATPEDFRESLARDRKAIREVYQRYFGLGEVDASASGSSTLG